jgi:SARP family transcriptional regulator, regulator of embCAB operon
MSGPRIYLTGDVAIVAGERLVRQDDLPGRQGRVVFAMLAGEHPGPVSRGMLEEELWGEDPPRAVGTALRALVSKVRSVLDGAGLADTLSGGDGAYRLTFPSGSWIDLIAAVEGVHAAEASLRAGDVRTAIAIGRAAATIAGRPLLAGSDGPWTAGRRLQLRDVRLRALDCLAEAWLVHGDAAQAVRDARAAVAEDPFHEPSHRLLIRGLTVLGDRAGALLAYDELRSTLAEELGADPSPETEALYLDVVRQA